MKEEELRKHGKCDICKCPIGASGIPLFYTVKIERYGLKMEAIKRQQGLAMVLGNNGILASAMGPNEDMATMVSTTELTVCETCASDYLTTITELALKSE